LPIQLAAGTKEHLGVGGQGGRFTKIDGHGRAQAKPSLGIGGPLPAQAAPRRRRRAPRQPQDQKATAAEIARLGQGDRQGEGSGHCRIEGIAALTQHGPAGCRGPRLVTGHHATGGPDRMKTLIPLQQRVGGLGSGGGEQGGAQGWAGRGARSDLGQRGQGNQKHGQK
jgi:hypothetical protein